MNFEGNHYGIKNAKLYTSPAGRVPLYMATSGEDSASIAGKHCDGLITFLKPDKVGKVFSAFDRSAQESGKDPAKLARVAEYKVAFAEDYDSAFKLTKFWRATEIDNVFS